MLVSFRKTVLLQGQADVKTKIKSLFKRSYVTQRMNVHRIEFISGICDESEVEQKVTDMIQRLIKYVPYCGNGENFSGWNKAIDDIKEVRKIYPNSSAERFVTETEPINLWRMDRILENLNGAQFAQFCKENGLGTDMLKK